MNQHKNLFLIASALLFMAGYGVFNTQPVLSAVFLSAGILLFPHRNRKHAGAVKGILAAAVITAALFLHPASHYHDSVCTVTFLDVGQGDCTFIELNDGKTVLIDAGLSEYGPSVVSFLKEKNIKRIDVLAATHPHNDHIGGLPDVISSIPIGVMAEPELPDALIPDSYSLRMLENAAKKHQISQKTVKAGDILLMGEDYELRVLSPGTPIESDDLNDYSMILMLEYGRTRFLFPSDAGYLSELELLKEDLHCDVLKIGHHGSFGSTSTAFLDAASPEYGIISVGKDNSYNLPSSYVLSRLTDYMVKTYRTDLDGTITAVSNGLTVRISTKNATVQH